MKRGLIAIILIIITLIAGFFISVTRKNGDLSNSGNVIGNTFSRIKSLAGIQKPISERPSAVASVRDN
ncbi:hypothetical protein A3F07_01255 [candidate division WWE3 bacterium RIFCSPHIGHO2_12_FULL_38_15]|uniref:Uncharacterized protein n=1 Tax=candidate division WWE3 bacterium RIFCSPHIGHO2_02_FULL_38_14 TaxID=1802620 RepID=A0A1F4V952_UNCKA|nr:MAG: hypothetical protein A2793_02040 [candidate division WWE3 bacterium RIFCSPHIGHO2_01_FULL_38_45]OGC48335.1 MAG: hypothetical protein A3F07_01255 [candidate division WWE3 bacterium RIFCSPHIGHO2_12_FULL_38_15]OGC53726.1 MAG: hypothetical protein A3D91_03770 [candidate division WWE3 bacterium RIFCSPHIGHO2_02_FULL_38_14]OGC54270.1 MAG: hypothetical protein A3B64_02055 [candidate division WWE3 bacterium RIFCSPLOWO2_01_FULL_37_24]HLB51513.1 hypothetical protein [Patescibacteria group bacterium